MPIYHKVFPFGGNNCISGLMFNNKISNILNDTVFKSFKDEILRTVNNNLIFEHPFSVNYIFGLYKEENIVVAGSAIDTKTFRNKKALLATYSVVSDEISNSEIRILPIWLTNKIKTALNDDDIIILPTRVDYFNN